MTIQCKTRDLLQAVERVGTVIPSRPQMQCLGGICVATDGSDSLVVEATDLQTWVRARLSSLHDSVDSTDFFAVLEYARLKKGLAALDKDGDIALSMAAGDGAAVLVQGKRQIKLKPLYKKREDYPEAPESGAPVFTTYFTGAELQRILDLTLFSAETGAVSRPYLIGLHVDAGPGQSVLNLCTTDGKRLSLVEHVLDNPASAPVNAIIPLSFLTRVVCKNIAGTAGDQRVRAVFYDRHVQFSVPGLAMTAAYVDGSFVNYRQVIPAASTFVHEARLETGALRKILKAVQGLHDKDSTERAAFSFSAAGQRLHVSWTGGGGDVSFAEDMDCAYTGEDVCVHFNYRYVAEMLDRTRATSVRWHWGAELAPVLMRVDDDSAYTHVLMPMRA